MFIYSLYVVLNTFQLSGNKNNPKNHVWASLCLAYSRGEHFRGQICDIGGNFISSKKLGHLISERVTVVFKQSVLVTTAEREIDTKAEKEAYECKQCMKNTCLYRTKYFIRTLNCKKGIPHFIFSNKQQSKTHTHLYVVSPSEDR